MSFSLYTQLFSCHFHYVLNHFKPFLSILHSLKPLLILLLSSLCISICGSTATNNRKTLNHVTNLDDSTTTTLTNPANFPPYTPTPTIVTIPASNPTQLPPLNPMPTTPTTTVPATADPTPTTTTPVNNAPVNNVPTQTSNAPAVTSGQTWCVAQTGASESALQSALDYACGIGGADCGTIQQGQSCYDPNTLENHASYAFNSYFQNNPVSTSCDFGGAANLVNTNPSSGSCIYPSSATAAGTGTGAGAGATSPPATTASTNGESGAPYGGGSGSPYGGVNGSPYEVPGSGSYGSPPSLMNSSYPASGFPTSYGPDGPPTGNIFPSGSTSMQPCISFIIVVATLSSAKLIFGSQ